MKSLRALIVRLCNLFRRKQQDREFAEEMESHLAMHIEDNLHSGMSPEEARRNALIKLGGLDRTIEEHRDRRGFQWIADLQRNFRYAFRRLTKSPLSSIVIISSLALGIGVNTAIYSGMRQILLRSLPVEKPEELALVTAPGAPKSGSTSTNESGGLDYIFSYPGFRCLEHQQQQHVEELAGFRYLSANIAYGNQTAAGSLLMVSGGYFPLMRVRPLIGRTLMPSDDTGEGNPVAMLGYNFWQNQLGSRTDILNQPIRIAGQVFTIIGVAPRGFHGTTVGMRPDVFIPLATNSVPSPKRMGENRDDNYWIYLVVRIKPGITRKQAAARYSGAYAAIVEEQLRTGHYPFRGMVKWLRKSRLTFIDGSRGYSEFQDGSKTPLFLLMAASGMVLLIAMVNAASLQLARSSARRRELAICAAMGANRSKIISPLLCEALTLSVAGGIAGLAISLLVLHFLTLQMAQFGAPAGFLAVQLEWPVLFYGLGISLATGLMFGLYPALAATRVAPLRVLNEELGRSSQSFGSAHVRKALVCAQVMIATVLLIPTGLLLRSLVKLTHASD